MNNQEFETKVLDINPEEIINKLREVGAEETPEFLQRRYVYNLEPKDPNSKDYEWIRIRTNGTKTTVTYKHKTIGNFAIGSTTEIETEVADFDKMAQILSKISVDFTVYQESKSHIFKLKDIEFSIDTWPKIKPFLEVEAKSLEMVQEGLKIIGLQGNDVGDKDIVVIYQEQVGFDPNSLSELKFD